MKRISTALLVSSGILVGFFCGAMVTTAYTDTPRFSYDQVVAQVGETKITRAQLAEQAIALQGMQILNNDMQDRALIMEAARRAGVTVSQAELDQRYAEMIQFAENEQAKRRFEALPRPVVDENNRMWMLAEKTMGITITEKDARDYFINHPQIFSRPPMAKLIIISTTDKLKAGEAYKRLQSGEDVQDLTVLYSTDPMLKQKRGDVGWVLRSSMSPEVAEKIFDANNGQGLKPGQFTEPIVTKSPDQQHDGMMITEHVIFYIDGIQPAFVPKFEEIKGSAMFYARADLFNNSANQWFKEQAKTIGKDYKQVKDLFDQNSPLESRSINPAKYVIPDRSVTGE